MSYTTSFEVIRRAAGRDSNAWSELIAAYEPWIIRNCINSGLKRQDADDIVQEVFRTLVTSIMQFEADSNGSFRGWLLRITRSRIVDHIRKTANRPRATGGTDAFVEISAVPDFIDDSTSLAALAFQLSEFEAVIQQLQDSFSDQTWKAFWLLAVDGWTSTEVGKELGMTAKAARLAKLRVMRRLKQELEPRDTSGVYAQFTTDH